MPPSKPKCQFFSVVISKIQSKQKQIKQSKSLTKLLIDWIKVLTKQITKILVPNQFPGLLVYVDELSRVLATWVKNLQTQVYYGRILKVQFSTAFNCPLLYCNPEPRGYKLKQSRRKHCSR